MLHADLVVAATGVKPHVEFIDGSEIVTDWGVHVDDHMRTTVAGVYAAGDVAEAADWLTGERYVHAIFPNAVAQAKIAAANAARRRHHLRRGRVHEQPQAPGGPHCRHGDDRGSR